MCPMNTRLPLRTHLTASIAVQIKPSEGFLTECISSKLEDCIHVVPDQITFQ